MNNDWTHGETVVARPFLSVDDYLKGVKFRLRSDRPFDGKDSYEAQDIDLDRLAPEFQLPLGEGLPPNLVKGLSLVVRLQDLNLRRSEIVFEENLDKAPATYAVPTSVAKQYAWKAGVRAIVTVMQREDRKRQAGQPYRRGHWIARRVFHVGRKGKSSNFPIEKWEPHRFEGLGLPSDTVYWLEVMSDDLNQSIKNPNEAFVLGIRADVFDAFAGSEDASARAFNAMLKAEVLTDLLVVGLSNMEGELVKGGLLASLVNRLNRSTDVKVTTLREWSKSPEGRAKIRAHVQTMTQARNTLARLKRGSQE